jgi:hypothetical protein
MTEEIAVGQHGFSRRLKMDEGELDRRFHAGLGLVREVGQEACRQYRRRDMLLVERKGLQDLVSETDRACEDEIVSALTRQLTSGHDGDRTGLVPGIHGERDVLGVRSLNVQSPIVLAREITLPAMGRPRLRLRLGTDGGQVWKLDVRHGEQVLQADEIKDETHPDRWKTLEVDLTPAAGQSGWLSVRLTCANGDHALWLKAAEVVY